MSRRPGRLSCCPPSWLSATSLARSTGTLHPDNHLLPQVIGHDAGQPTQPYPVPIRHAPSKDGGTLATPPGKLSLGPGRSRPSCHGVSSAWPCHRHACFLKPSLGLEPDPDFFSRLTERPSRAIVEVEPRLRRHARLSVVYKKTRRLSLHSALNTSSAITFASHPSSTSRHPAKTRSLQTTTTTRSPSHPTST